MTCNECIHRVEKEIMDDVAFDTEFKQGFPITVEYCDHHCKLCCDAYSNCEYRDLEVTAEEIQHVINLIGTDMPVAAMEELHKLLEG